ncbi:hypothetical protein CPB86DRAFT_323893 [Serendipita vermifera]|nr:hypothetical protein CPB86DRAFT_323893 [Serendipita vermifera]
MGRVDDIAKSFLSAALGESLFSQFRSAKDRDFGILNQAIPHLRRATSLMSRGPAKATCFRVLGQSFYTLHQRNINALYPLHRRSSNDLNRHLDDSISAFNKANEHAPEDPVTLFYLGNALCTRFRQNGNVTDAYKSISAFDSALDVLKDDNATKSILYNNLGDALFALYQKTRNETDIQWSIDAFKEAMDLLPAEHSDRSQLLTGLGNALCLRFKLSHNQKIIDIDESIRNLDAALECGPETYKAPFLRNLGDALLTKYQYNHNRADLEKALSRLTEAVELTRDDSRRQPRLRKLVDALAIAPDDFTNSSYGRVLANARRVVSQFSAEEGQPITVTITD